MRLLAGSGAARVTPVPYDFDFSGMVNASYAAPPANLKIRSVRTRYFRGFCKEEKFWRAAAQLFNNKRETVYQSYQALPQLKKRQKDKSLKYLDQFYKLINDPSRFERSIVKHCR